MLLHVVYFDKCRVHKSKFNFLVKVPQLFEFFKFESFIRYNQITFVKSRLHHHEWIILCSMHVSFHINYDLLLLMYLLAFGNKPKLYAFWVFCKFASKSCKNMQKTVKRSILTCIWEWAAGQNMQHPFAIWTILLQFIIYLS